jgi:two-component system, LytTR family, response regulator
MNRRVVVCEDEPLARDTLRDFIAAQPGLQLVGEASDGVMALRMVRALAPELVFMDIQMPELSGLEVVRQLDPLPPVIFTTAYDQHAVAAFELNAVDYLLKPFSRQRFQAAVQRVLSEAVAPRDATVGALGAAAQAQAALLDRILVRDRGQIFPLALTEIEYLRSDLKYTLLAARGSSFYVRLALTELEPRLDPARFLRVHRNAIINLDHVLSMKSAEQSQLEILMRDGTRLLANRDASRLLRDASI